MIEAVRKARLVADRASGGSEMNKKRYALWIALFVIAALLGLGQRTVASERNESQRTDMNAEVLTLVSRARVNLVRRSGVDATQIVLQSVAPAEFPDPSLGAPEPNKAYPLVATPGYSIRLKVGDVVYRYWAANGRIVYVGSFLELATARGNQPVLSGKQSLLSR
jgi:hypothetical protein